MRIVLPLAACGIAAIVSAAPLRAQHDMHDMTGMHDSSARAANDTGFAAMQRRGMTAMGVDQYKSTHHFTPAPNGGTIELLMISDDSAGTVQIRRHLREIAHAFGTGDFSTPMFVHMRTVPGTAEMAAKRSVISYHVTDEPRGGRVDIRSTDSAAVRAIHDFLAFQRSDHHASAAK